MGPTVMSLLTIYCLVCYLYRCTIVQLRSDNNVLLKKHLISFVAERIREEIEVLWKMRGILRGFL